MQDLNSSATQSPDTVGATAGCSTQDPDLQVAEALIVRAQSTRAAQMVERDTLGPESPKVPALLAYTERTEQVFVARTFSGKANAGHHCFDPLEFK